MKPNDEVLYEFNTHAHKYCSISKKTVPDLSPHTRPATFLKMRGNRAVIRIKDPCGFRELSVPLSKIKQWGEDENKNRGHD